MKYNIDCPFCDETFEAFEWESGKCPKCGEEYYWDEQPLPEGDEEWADSWVFVMWENEIPLED